MVSESEAPYVAVVGGFNNLDDAEKSDAIKIAESLGAALAHAGFNLIVYNSDEDFLEPHVVRGYVPQAQDRKKCIRIRIPQKLRTKVRFDEEKTHQEMFDAHLFPSGDWEAPFFRSLSTEDDADAVVLVSGGKSTFIAGHIALARNLPLLAVEAVPGSANEIWSQQKTAHDETRSWEALGPEALVTQFRAECDRSRTARADRERAIASIESWASARRYAWFCGATLLVFVLALGYTIIGQPGPDGFRPSPEGFQAATIIGLLAAGATGAMARGVMWANTRSDPVTSLLLGALAGLVVGLGYIVPQLVGLGDQGGAFNTELTVVGPVETYQFLTAALVSISAGVGFDSVFDRLRAQAKVLPIGPEGGERR